MPQLTISNITIDVVRKDIKNIHLSVNPPDGSVKIASPLRIDDEAIRLFAISKIPWIKKQQKKFENQQRQSERNFITRESHYYKGQRFLLNIIEVDSQKKQKIHVSNNKLIMRIKKSITKEQRKKLLTEWYRSELKNMIPPLINKWEKKIGVKLSGWKVRQMKTKWGSCNIENRTILLNLELAKKPVQCLEYIVVHELLHLIERNHNKQFMKLLDSHLPQWELYRDQLNQFPISHPEWSY